MYICMYSTLLEVVEEWLVALHTVTILSVGPSPLILLSAGALLFIVVVKGETLPASWQKYDEILRLASGVHMHAMFVV